LTIALGLLLSTAASASASAVAQRVSSVSPGKGPTAGGTTVTIAGEYFGAIVGVKFGSRNAASFEVVSSTKIIAVSPPWVSGNAIAEVTVETMSMTGVNSIGDSFIYEPTVTKVEPASGPAAGGTSVTISGEAFEGLFENGAGEMPPFVESVQFGSHKASFDVESGGRITAISPPGAGTADVTVTTLGGTSAASPADRFSYATASSTGPP
jgi:IPT/TIG domain